MAGCTALSGIPDLDSADGRIYRQHYSGCHGVPDPRFRSFEEWQRVLPDMERRISEKGLPAISIQEREAILKYLRTYAKATGLTST